MSKPLLHLGEVFREDFFSPFHVAQNGGTVNGNPVINNGAALDGTGDYITYNNLFSGATNISLVIRFVPDFDYDEDARKTLYDSSNNSFRLQKLNNANGNALRINISGGLITVTAANYLAYWLQNQENVVVVSGVSGNNNVWLNGTQIVAGNSTTWSIAQPATFYLGSEAAGNAFSGEIVSFSVLHRLVSNDEAVNDYSNASFQYKNTLKGFWPLRDQVGSSTFTTSDLSRYGNALTLGASTAKPTKLVHRNGFRTDGGDKINSAAGIITETGEVTFAVWGRLGLKTTTQCIASYEETTADPGVIFLYISGVYYFYCGSTGNPASIAEINPDTEEFFLVGVHNGTTTDIYLNGRKGTTGASPIAPDVTSAMTLNLFVRGNGSTQPCSANTEIYQVGLWTEGLSEAQILDLYKKGSRYFGSR